MPELPPMILKLNFSSKSATVPSQTRKLLPPGILPSGVWPVIASSLTDHKSGRPFQPVRSLPLKSACQSSAAKAASGTKSERVRVNKRGRRMMLILEGTRWDADGISYARRKSSRQEIPMTAADAYAELIRRTKETAVLASCGAVLGWDEQTYMPRDGSAFRGEQMALLARLTHEMTHRPGIGELLGDGRGLGLVATRSRAAAVNVREIRRAYDRAVKLPKELVEELARVTTRAPAGLAGSAGDRATSRRSARGSKRSSRSSAGGRRRRLQGPPLRRAARRVRAGATAARDHARSSPPCAPSWCRWSRRSANSNGSRGATSWSASSRSTGRQRLRRGGGRGDRLRLHGRPARRHHAPVLLAASAPATAASRPATTRSFFNEAFFGILHEAGHGIYEQGLPAEHFGTPLGTCCSLGIHESQSRLWENQVGRGRPFWEHFFPQCSAGVPDALGDVSLDDFYFAINDVRAVVHPRRGRRGDVQPAHHPALRAGAGAACPAT